MELRSIERQTILLLGVFIALVLAVVLLQELSGVHALSFLSIETPTLPGMNNLLKYGPSYLFIL